VLSNVGMSDKGGVKYAFSHHSLDNLVSTEKGGNVLEEPPPPRARRTYKMYMQWTVYSILNIILFVW